MTGGRRAAAIAGGDNAGAAVQAVRHVRLGRFPRGFELKPALTWPRPRGGYLARRALKKPPSSRHNHVAFDRSPAS